jgi:hypothetical protein
MMVQAEIDKEQTNVEQNGAARKAQFGTSFTEPCFEIDWYGKETGPSFGLTSRAYWALSSIDPVQKHF